MERPLYTPTIALLNTIDMEDGSYGLDYYWYELGTEQGSGVLPITDIEAAVEQCLASGWIKIMSEQDCEEDRLRWREDSNQNWSECPYQVGNIDFTGLGWAVYLGELKARHGTDWNLRFLRSSQYIWRIPGQVSIIAGSAEYLSKELAEVRSGTDCLVGGGLSANHTVGNICGPYDISPWWVKRFYCTPTGYRVDIFFEPADLDFS